MDQVFLERLKREEFKENNISRIVDEFDKCMSSIGEVTFIMEGDSQTDTSKQFVWERYGKDLYIQIGKLEKLMIEVIENW